MRAGDYTDHSISTYNPDLLWINYIITFRNPKDIPKEPAISHIGEILSLSTAVVWALAMVLFKKSGEHIHPIALNLFKNSLAVVLFLITIVVMNQAFVRNAPVSDYIIILLSGAIGLGVSDTLLFKSLNMLGAGMTAIINCLYIPIIITLSLLWLDEYLTVVTALGSLMILCAIAVATVQKKTTTITRGNLIRGISWGVLSIVLAAISIILVKPVLNRTPLIWFTYLRLLGGTAVIFLIMILHPNRQNILRSLRSKSHWKYLVTGSFLGSYISMTLWLAGMKYSQVSIAGTLSQTSNIFIFIFAALFLKEKITTPKLIAITLAALGVFLVTYKF